MLLRSRSHALALRSRFSRAAALSCLCVLVLTSTGCFGSFPLTRTVYQENQEISDVEFHQTLAFWAMTLTLVYPGAALSDMLVMNAIEFWKPEPASWESSEAFVPVPSDRYESLNEAPVFETTEAVSAGSSLDDADIPIAPVMEAPVLEAPGRMMPSSPAIPLPLPAYSPVFEEPETPVSSRTLSRSDGPGYSF